MPCHYTLTLRHVIPLSFYPMSFHPHPIHVTPPSPYPMSFHSHSIPCHSTLILSHLIPSPSFISMLPQNWTFSYPLIHWHNCCQCVNSYSLTLNGFLKFDGFIGMETFLTFLCNLIKALLQHATQPTFVKKQIISSKQVWITTVVNIFPQVCQRLTKSKQYVPICMGSSFWACASDQWV